MALTRPEPPNSRSPGGGGSPGLFITFLFFLKIVFVFVLMFLFIQMVKDPRLTNKAVTLQYDNIPNGKGSESSRVSRGIVFGAFGASSRGVGPAPEWISVWGVVTCMGHAAGLRTQTYHTNDFLRAGNSGVLPYRLGFDPLERTLRFRDIPESMSTSVSTPSNASV